MRFQIECISKDMSRPFLFARQLDSGDFALTEAPLLGGVAIKRSLTQPRALKPAGSPDLSIFALQLASASDVSKLQGGEVVELGHA